MNQHKPKKKNTATQQQLIGPIQFIYRGARIPNQPPYLVRNKNPNLMRIFWCSMQLWLMRVNIANPKCSHQQQTLAKTLLPSFLFCMWKPNSAQQFRNVKVNRSAHQQHSTNVNTPDRNRLILSNKRNGREKKIGDDGTHTASAHSTHTSIHTHYTRWNQTINEEWSIMECGK